jgi:hypothetical protein
MINSLFHSNISRSRIPSGVADFTAVLVAFTFRVLFDRPFSSPWHIVYRSFVLTKRNQTDFFFFFFIYLTKLLIYPSLSFFLLSSCSFGSIWINKATQACIFYTPDLLLFILSTQGLLNVISHSLIIFSSFIIGS